MMTLRVWAAVNPYGGVNSLVTVPVRNHGK
jgi:hypothetical protein